MDKSVYVLWIILSTVLIVYHSIKGDSEILLQTHAIFFIGSFICIELKNIQEVIAKNENTDKK